MGENTGRGKQMGRRKSRAHALATAFRTATPYTIGSEMPLIFW